MTRNGLTRRACRHRAAYGACAAARSALAVAATASLVHAEQRTVTLPTSPQTTFPTNIGTTTYIVKIDGGNPAESTVSLSGLDRTIDALTIDRGDILHVGFDTELTILQGFTLDGTLRFRQESHSSVTLPAGQGLSGTGVVSGTAGAIRNAGGTFAIGPDIRVEGSSLWIATRDVPLINHGTIVARSTQNPVIAPTITLFGNGLTNHGTIHADGGTVVFDVPFTRIADLGNIVHSNGGRFRIGNVLDNTGRTFTTDNGTGDWEIGRADPTESTLIRGGRLASADGRALHVVGNATFDGVTLDGDVRLQRGTLRLDNLPEVLGSGTIHLDADVTGIHASSPALVIGPELTVVGRTLRTVHYDYGIGDASRPTVNKGRLVAEKVLQVNGSSFTNQGYIEIKPGGVLAINTPLKFSDLGGTIDNQGAIRILGTLDNAGQTFTVPNALGQWELGGTIRGGTIETPGGGELVVRGESQAVTLDDVRMNGTLRVKDFHFSTLRIPAGQTLAGTGTIIGDNSSSSTLTGDDGLTIETGMTIAGTIRIGDERFPLVNRGSIVADVWSGIHLAGSSISNPGTIEVKNDSYVSFSGNYTLSDLGQIVNDGGGRVRFGNPFSPTTLDLTGETLHVDAQTGRHELMGTIRGGTIRTAPAHALELYRDSTLDGVRLDGATLRVHGRAAIARALTGTGEIVLVKGSEPSALAFTGPTAHLAPTIVVRETEMGSRPVIGDTTRSLVNEGTIRADFELSSFSLRGTTITNGGTLRTTRRATIAATAASLVFDDGGTLDAIVAPSHFFDPQPPLVVIGDLDLSTAGDRLELTLDPAAALHTPYQLSRYTGTLTGIFDHVTPGFTVDYSTPGVIFVTAVPEPVAGSVFVLGSILLHRRRRRRSTLTK